MPLTTAARQLTASTSLLHEIALVDSENLSQPQLQPVNNSNVKIRARSSAVTATRRCVLHYGLLVVW
jgi:hypothetical protein